MHVHVGALSTAITFAEVIIALFILRLIAARWPHSPMGMASAALN